MLSHVYLLEGVQQEVLPLGRDLDLVQDEGQKLWQVANGDGAQRVAGGRLHLLGGRREGCQQDLFQVADGAQVTKNHIITYSVNKVKFNKMEL